ncbi:caspase-22 [Danio aesculapii]|uniref:caspase-22 n=1 Tax=Danio aesculapii TaxID=1142201 RepID=UPI0024C066EB|nr:caspase-22 [Danio aesculapii]
MADQLLENLRIPLIKGLSERVINGLLDDLQQNRVFGEEEIEDIQQKMKTRTDQARHVIDDVKRKGVKASEIMLTCLKTRDAHLYDTLDIDRLLAPVPETEATPSQLPETTGCYTDKTNTMPEYEMNSNPRGLCLIFNNENFRNPKMKRYGSQKDADSLKDLFESLGFLVEIKKDQTVSAMKMTLKQYSENRQHGDCFVCCVLSHGDESGVLGYDEQICPVDDITSPFNGANCSSLAGKPKVFFIQACRGEKIQSKVMVADCLGGSRTQKPGRVSVSIPKDSDFLIARSTVEGYVSIRDEIRGSWFIQSLCENLKEGSKRGHDILSILTKVNNDVSLKEGYLEVNKDRVDAKVTPQPIFTLRKLLIFRPLKRSGWFS